MKKSLLALVSLVLASVVVMSCAKSGPLSPATKAQNGSIMVSMDVLDNVASGTVNITQGPLSFTSPLNMSMLHGVGTTAFNDLQTGTWTVTAKLFDSTSTLRYFATGTVTVNLYQTTPVTLLITAGGKLSIVVGVAGNDIIFSSDRNGSYTLYKMDGSGTVSAISGISQCGYSAANPRIGGSYYYSRIGGNLCSITKDGSWNHILLDTSHGENYGDVWGQPSWDGSKIAFWQYGSTTNTANCIGVGLVSGGNLTSYYYNAQNGTSNRYPAWTPDGRIVYLKDSTDIWIMNSDGSNRALISSASGCYKILDVSSSNQILYLDVASSISRINIDGTGRVTLTSAGCNYARYRNDDQVIIYQQNTVNGNRIYTMNNDSTGSSKTLISTGVAAGKNDVYPSFMY